MPASRVIKPSKAEASISILEKTKPVKVRVGNRAQSELQVPPVRKSRASSCPRRPQRERCERSAGAQHTAFKVICERRTRSSSTAPKSTANSKPECRRVTNSVGHPVNPKCPEKTGCPGQKEQRSAREETKHAIQSYKAFTVIPPNPKKRREIQRKAEAELVALEELRLSRAMAYVSINPSSVGGCMSLEEVRSKQQQEMMQAKRKQKPV